MWGEMTLEKQGEAFVFAFAPPTNALAADQTGRIPSTALAIVLAFYLPRETNLFTII